MSARDTAKTGVSACVFFLLSLWFPGLNILTNLSIAQIAVADIAVHYEMTIEGISDRKLLAEMKAISDTVAMKDRPPASLSLLQRRVKRDTSRFLQLLKSNSYYKAQVKFDIDSKGTPARIIFRVHMGPPYILKSVNVQITGDYTAQAMGSLRVGDIGLNLHEPVKASAVISAQKELLRRLKNTGFPFAKVTERTVIVDHADQSITVLFNLDSGHRARFGDTTITGLKSVDEAVVRKEIPWREGDFYNSDLLAEAQRRLTGLGLFATIRIIAGESLNESQRLPMTIAVTERKHRSVRGGISYKTDEGPGAALSWENRNLFRQGEYLGVAVNVSDFIQAAEGGFRKPYFWRDDQSLRVLLRLAEDRPDAYTSRSVKSSVLIERRLSKQIKVGGGLAFKASKVEQIGAEERYRLLSLPILLDWDTSNDLLNPTRGSRMAFEGAPFYDTLGADLGFVKGQMSLTRYLSLLKKPSLVAAGRLALGAIEGAKLRSIPADERFYAGGGGSIRGYAYQSVGPLIENRPVGGRSLLELSFELRAKLTSELGLVLFIDGGSAFESAVPDFKEDILWGAGLGFRYFTPIGPMRLDVGIPLNRRENIDDSFQLYLSLGQAF